MRSLLESHESGGAPSHATSEFFEALGLSPTSALVTVSDENDRKLQVAINSFSVRHHAAEALARLLLAVTTPRDATAPFSTWAAIADGPTALHAVATDLRARLSADEHLISRAFFMPGAEGSEQTRTVLQTAWVWVRRALFLLTDNDLTVNAADNKVKHGLAVSTRNDVRVDFIQAAELDENGGLPLSALEDSTPIFDRPSLAYLARAYPPQAQGLEVSSLLIDPPRVLAEAWMMAVVHAAVFHVAAQQHFGDSEAKIAPCPALHLRPTPDDLLADRVHGYRGVLTTPLGDSVVPRDSGLFIGGAFIPITIDFDGVMSTTIVED
ncbi:hypothetical protein J2X63_003498 [Agromyces sp. 3263]|uniref:hypothetical protein n=1 Tax=Agromyces sp. 3263 TaxID=2817750 RepID=UPI0028549265|nr:hypothetical protein [Agromyces sp. 3263]MDR6907790.1 hypothetical protein [Agromyces sp. 3263]